MRRALAAPMLATTAVLLSRVSCVASAAEDYFDFRGELRGGVGAPADSVATTVAAADLSRQPLDVDGYVAGDDDELESALVSWLERQRRRAESDASALLASPNPTLELDPPTANASAQARALDFVRVEGTKFFAGCDEYKIAGWNTYTLIEQAARLPVGSFEANFSLDGRRQVLDMLDAAVDAGFNTVRTWAYSVGKHQSLQIAPGVYHEPLFDGLDWVVYQAGLPRGRLILVFTDYWEYNGGVAQYMDWAGVTAPTKNAFFTDRECKRLYKANARAVIERVNRYTGIAYRDDPAVFAWELINEPRCRNCARHLQDWIEEMAKYVKSLDANHLLSTGQEGFYAAGAKGSVDANPELWALTTGQSFVENHDVPEIDFAVAHLWPDNWGVFSLGGSLGDDFSVDWIRAHERDARELLGKPLVLEEQMAAGAGRLSRVGDHGRRWRRRRRRRREARGGGAAERARGRCGGVLSTCLRANRARERRRTRARRVHVLDVAPQRPRAARSGRRRVRGVRGRPGLRRDAEARGRAATNETTRERRRVRSTFGCERDGRPRRARAPSERWARARRLTGGGSSGGFSVVVRRACSEGTGAEVVSDEARDECRRARMV